MERIHKKLVDISLLKINLENSSVIETEFLYKNITNEFYKTFSIKLTNLHDILFGNVKIGFYNYIKDRKEMIGAAKIFLKDLYYEDFDNIQRFTIYDKALLEKADYYNANWKPIGTVVVKFNVEERIDLLEDDEEDTIINSIFRLCIDTGKKESFRKIFNLVTEAKEGSFLCNFWTLLGCLPADYYYSFLYGMCDKVDCDGLKCKKEFCEKSYSIMNENEATKAYFILQEAAAAYATGVPVHNLQTIRKRDDIINKKYRSILERLLINDGDLIEYTEGHDDVCGFLIYFKRKSVTERPTSIGISFRGTFSTTDAINDLQTNYVEFQDGYTHLGFKKIADHFMKTKMTQIIQIAQSENINEIFLTGHSLGAAVATLVHVRILEKYSFLNVKSVIFGSPPVFSENLVKKIKLNLTHYAYETDIITRLSYGSLLDLRYFCLSVSSLLGLITTPAILTSKIDEVRMHIKKYNSNPKLYHPGRLIHIKSFEGVYKVKQVEYKFFDEILFCRTAVWDHFLHNLSNTFIYSTIEQDEEDLKHKNNRNSE